MGLIPDFGILGINARNLLYVRPFNKKKAVRMADDKLKSKHFLSARDIPVPRLFAVIRNQEELEKFDFSSLPPSFVVKPNMGFGGEGIIPFVGRKDGKFEKSSGTMMEVEELKEHIGDILEGRFSLSGVTDVAFFEQRIVCDDALAAFSYKGLPDIRIVVHNLIPVMAMLRLPTKESDGKANIHQGALGVGIDIAKGTATHIVQKGKIIDEVPEVGEIRGLKIPYWDEMLHISSKVQLIANLGYLAVDLVLDKNTGPVLLEINARAGLAVQIANLAPLRKRLERIQGVKVTTPEKGVRIAQDMFGNKVEKEVKKVTGKEVIGSHEKLTIFGAGGSRIVWASINPLLERSIIDRELVSALGIDPPEETTDSVKIKFNLAETRIQTLARVEDLSGKSFDLVLGRRDLSHFLIDPSKGKSAPSRLPNFDKKKKPVDINTSHTNYRELDQDIISIDRQLKLLYHLKPINLKDERDAFMKDNSYEPQFQYTEFMFDPLHLKEKIRDTKKKIGDSALSKMFSEKLTEIEKKIALLEAIGTDHFMDRSIDLFGKPSDEILQEAQKKLDQKPKHYPKLGKMDTDQIVLAFDQCFKDYGLEQWKVKMKRDMVAVVMAGKRNALFIREGVRFSENRLRMVIAHEIETHILTAENGKAQNYQLFNRGFANYLQTQEGLAIWNQEQVSMVENEKNYRAAILVFVVNFAMKHGFAATFDYCRKLGMTKKRAFQTTLKVKRGLEDTSKPGAFTKDMIYFTGYHQIKAFVEQGGDLKDLYYGKYNLDDLELIKQVPFLVEPRILPHFLRH